MGVQILYAVIFFAIIHLLAFRTLDEPFSHKMNICGNLILLRLKRGAALGANISSGHDAKVGNNKNHSDRNCNHKPSYVILTAEPIDGAAG